MTADEVLEAMARGMWEAESMRARGAPRMVPWSEATPSVQEAWRSCARAAIRALPPGWVVAKVPEPKGELQVGKTSGVYAIAAAIVCTYDAGYDAALAAVRASAVEVE